MRLIKDGDLCTEREFFNQKLACGDLPRRWTMLGGVESMSPNKCKARDWRVVKHNLFSPWERALKCNNCNMWTLVEVEDWKERGTSKPK